MFLHICVCAYVFVFYICMYENLYIYLIIYICYWRNEGCMHGLFVCLSKLQESMTVVWHSFLWLASFLALAFPDSLIPPLLWSLIYISITLDSLIAGRLSLTSCAAPSDILLVVGRQEVFGINACFFFLPLSFSMCYFIDIICIYKNGG